MSKVGTNSLSYQSGELIARKSEVYIYRNRDYSGALYILFVEVEGGNWYVLYVTRLLLTIGGVEGY